MIKYNKLSCFILFSLASQFGHSLSFDSANIQSTQGQLLYAEIPYRNANGSQPVQVSFASTDDLSNLGTTTAPDDNLNIFVRPTSASTGVIVITSNRPMTNDQINVAVKVQDADGTYIQQVNKNFSSLNIKAMLPTARSDQPLIPQLVTEKEIALNLPTSTRYNQAESVQTATNADQALAIQTTSLPKPQASQPISTNSTSVSPHTVQAVATTPSNQALAQKTKNDSPDPAAAKKTQKKPAASTEKHYTVKHQDSLWTIASRISAQTHQPIPVVMKQIQALNEHAFVSGNINRIKQGTQLNLDLQHTPAPTKIAHPTTQAVNTKYRLDQAQMSLITNQPDQLSNQSAAQQAHQRAALERSIEHLSLTRQKTLTLQKQVSQLDFALQQKDHKLQLLNARLAQLQQQLQQRQMAKKLQHH
ncbi:hypothetical protein [Acinetobacter sp. MD2]|uniref:FimV/HubP-related protein n=1 Tax=Acinetobacter sp. MD2 TaxID=2600066 RepID=UPI002D1F685B|nr:hypothetical protein [Acinetobacter sp. MD2]MEB3767176.1 hypothetical protein [Acinetobacter sp. MD2]